MPTTSPERLMRGPPLFPGLMAASVCKKPSKLTSPAWILLFLAEITPTVTVCSSPKGFPMATTHSPTSKRSESPKFNTGSFFASILMTAKSKVGSVPRTFAGNVRPSERVTVILSAPSTTWLFVKICPSSVTTKPEPRPFIGIVRENR